MTLREVVQMFVNDCEAAYGDDADGNGGALHEDWFDLFVTYRAAVETLKADDDGSTT